MQIKQLARPISASRFKDLMLFLLENFPEVVSTIDGDVQKEDIVYESYFLESGLYTCDGCKILTLQTFHGFKDFIHRQLFDRRFRNYSALLLAIDGDTWDGILAELPEDECKTYLTCLVFSSLPAEVREEEKNLIRRYETIKLQNQVQLVSPQDETDQRPFEQRLFVNPGITFLHNHTHVESWGYLRDRLLAYKQCGMRRLYVELPAREFGPVFEYFNRTGDEDFLREFVELYTSTRPECMMFLIAVCMRAYQHRIQIIPMDSSYLLDPNCSGAEIYRAINHRNQFMATSIYRNELQQDGGKFAMLIGAIHSNVANFLNIPSIALCPDRQVIAYTQSPIDSQECYESMQHLKTGAHYSVEVPSYQVMSQSTLCKYGMFAAAGVVVIAGITIKAIEVMSENAPTPPFP